ncbi:MAG: DUF2092 domain-containing protein [Gammaproteobacteria bacterium]|jgi:hypothetical protein|nr:DUF2092 domain-containing protein [Gammaproteobacteria bacterium]
MFRMKKWFFCSVCLLLMSVPALSGAQEKKPSIDPQADNTLRQMSAYLGGFQQFTFHIENSVDTLLPCKQKLQLSRAVDMFVKRPNRLRANIDGDRVSQELYYDGKSITLYGKDVNVYASLDAPPTIDAAMDYAIESYGLVAPMVDLIYGDSYEILIENVQSGSYVGLSKVFGVECHHLAFQGAETDWQIWIENSKTPLPRKIVITSKWVAGAPQLTTFLNNWDASTPIKESIFSFKAPDTAEKIEFLPADKIATFD